MIVVDTSVWVDVMRRRSSNLAATLQSLLDADEVALALPVRFELLSGVARKDRRQLTRALTALPILRPSDDTWDAMEPWIVRCADAGVRCGVTDLLIAALADEIGALVWSLDSDFSHLERLGLVRLYA